MAASGKEERAGLRTHRAARCGECHEKMYREWRESPHAHTGDSELYVALRKTSDASCDRCHEPLRGIGAGVELARSEGVGCDVCHRMERVEVRSGHAEASLQTTGNTKYGPRCDPRRPYFHKAECRPIFGKSELCAACHLLAVPDSSGELLPVHTEYADWLSGPYAARGKTCQSCHMLPGVEAELAVGEAKREGVPDHGFWGRQAELRGTGLSVQARATWKGTDLSVTVQLANARAGHFIPAEGAGQQVVLRVVCLARDGEEIGRSERIFERRSVDASGEVASFPAAVRVASDNRIGPLETRRERFELGTPDATSARVALLRRTDPELSKRLGIGTAPEQLISEVVLPLRSGNGAHRVSSRELPLAR